VILLCKFTVQHYGDCYKIIFLNSNSRGNKIQIDAIVGLPNSLVGGLHNNLVLPEAIHSKLLQSLFNGNNIKLA